MSLVEFNSTFNPQSISAGEVKERNIKSAGVTYRTLPLRSNGAEIFVNLPKLFCFGIKKFANGGMSMSLALHDRDGATDEQLEFGKYMNRFFDRVKDLVVERAEEIGEKGLTKAELRKLIPLWLCGEKTPVLNVKVPEGVDLFDEDGLEITPDELVGKYFTTKACLSFPSVYIGTTIKLQCVLHDACVWLSPQRPKIRFSALAEEKEN